MVALKVGPVSILRRRSSTQSTSVARSHASPVVAGGGVHAGARSSPTQIVVPAHYAPHGYKVSVDDGRIVSAPGARYLEVLPMSNRNVTVTLQPA